MNEASIAIAGVRKVFSSPRGDVEALAEISFRAGPHEIVSIIGPSGCGKTTLLQIAAGLLEPTRGTVQVAPPGRRPMMIFQQYERCLLPFLTVERNVAIAILNASMANGQKQERVTQALQTTGLLDARHMYPWELSSGMQQRVLFARTLAAQPPCILLDEPFASVDSQTRYELEDALHQLASGMSASVLYVTHDIDSAVYCGHRVLVLSPRPARVIADIPVPLGTTRTQVEARRTPEFASVRSRIYEMLSASRR